MMTAKKPKELRISDRASTTAVGVIELTAEVLDVPESIPAKHRRSKYPQGIELDRPSPSEPRLSDETLEALRANFDAEAWNADDEIDVCQLPDKVNQA